MSSLGSYCLAKVTRVPIAVSVHRLINYKHTSPLCLSATAGTLRFLLIGALQQFVRNTNSVFLFPKTIVITLYLLVHSVIENNNSWRAQRSIFRNFWNLYVLCLCSMDLFLALACSCILPLKIGIDCSRHYVLQGIQGGIQQGRNLRRQAT